MKRQVAMWVAALLVFGGCGNAAQQEKIDELSKKVATLEKRVKALESGHKAPKGKGAKAKGKAGKAKAKAPGGVQPPKGKVEVTGDAAKVMLTNGKRKFPVPGDLPAGEYTVLAAFDASGEPSQAGTATVTAEKSVTVDCKSAEKACTATAAP